MIGALIRDLRNSLNWSQGELAERLCIQAGRPSLTREEVSRWGRGKVIPGAYWLAQLARTFEVPIEALREAVTLSRINRRAFLNLTTMTAVHGPLAADMVASVAGADPVPLTTVQTTHMSDLVIASKADASVAARLRRWMMNGETPVLRVNAAGILAKLPGLDTATEVARTLQHDDETRNLYMTAVIARVCALDWGTAGRLAANPMSLPDKAKFLAARLATEVMNPRDAGARWCSAVMLRDLSPQLG